MSRHRHPADEAYIVSRDHWKRNGRRRRLESSLGDELDEGVDALVRASLCADDPAHSVDNPLVPPPVEPLNQVTLALDAETRAVVRDELGSLAQREWHIRLEIRDIGQP
jgi:hypothetical protein